MIHLRSKPSKAKNPFRLTYTEHCALETYLRQGECEQTYYGHVNKRMTTPLIAFLLAHVCYGLSDAGRLMHGIPAPRSRNGYDPIDSELTMNSLNWYMDKGDPEFGMFTTLSGGLAALEAMTGVKMDVDEIRAAVEAGIEPKLLDPRMIVGNKLHDANRAAIRPRKKMDKAAKERFREIDNAKKKAYREAGA